MGFSKPEAVNWEGGGGRPARARGSGFSKVQREQRPRTLSPARPMGPAQEEQEVLEDVVVGKEGLLGGVGGVGLGAKSNEDVVGVDGDGA